MDNENKEPGLEPQDTEVTVGETDFDPTESEEFYSNLEAAIGGEELPEEAKAVEAVLLQDVLDDTEENVMQDTAMQDNAEDALFAGVNAALAEQIEQEFGKTTVASSVEEPEKEKKSVWKSIPTWTKVLAGVILVILLSVGFLFGTAKGREILVNIAVEFAFGRMHVEDDELTPTPEPPVTGETTPGLTPTSAATPTPVENPQATPEPTGGAITDPTDEPTPTPTPTVTPTPAIVVMDDEDVINVLLLGEENMYHSTRGRTDVMILVSVDLNGGPLKMVSFQRDLWVEIPGYGGDRLNAAYGKKGGAKLVMETIEQNFGVDVDAYIKIDFEGFENLIDSLGGLELSLTARESEYLNTTDYISKPSERNTVAGKQKMTGAQVLGYCRVRYVPTENGLKDDRGRNYRHRVVLQAIFDQFKNKNITQLSSVMLDCFDYVTVPANLESLSKKCLTAVIEKRMFTIETLQLPKSGLYKDTKIEGKQVILPYRENIKELQKFIYGE